MKCYSARYCMALMGSIGMGIIYGLKVNFHVTIMAMVNHTALDDRDANDTDTDSSAEDGPFTWNSGLRGIMLSAYFWGYLIGQIPGGRMSELWSAKWVLFIAVALNVVLALLTPLLAFINPWVMVAVRVGQGIGGGFSFPAMHALLAKWAIPTERSVMSTISYCGTAAGTVMYTFFAGPISKYLGWEFVFYLEGGISSIWLILWVILVTDKPETQKLITQSEKELISESLKNEGEGGEHPPMPWKKAMLSPAFLAILVAHTCSNWGWYMFLTELPTYLTEILNYKIKENAFISSVPYFCMLIFSLILSKLLDIFITKKTISTTVGRKIATSFASFVPALCLTGVCFTTARLPTVLLMTVAIMCIAGMYCGFLGNHIDIAPNFAGTLMAITNTVATLPGIMVPIFVGWLTQADSSVKSWRIVFIVTIILYLIEFIFYLIFGSGEEQSWNKPEN